MKLPQPRPGLVIRYGFLWSPEAHRGATEASKDRPCAIIVSFQRYEEGDARVLVAPITHSPPADASASIPIPPAICRQLGLDSQAQWLRFDELNSFSWPGFDLRPIPGRDTMEYGLLPEHLFQQLRTGILKRQRAGQSKRPVERD